jgi:branched-chain amino acid transport system permease protein
MEQQVRRHPNRFLQAHWVMFVIALALPILDIFLPPSFRTADLMRPIFILAILGLGLNIVTGFTGMLNLGVAAFMAIGVYSYAILTCDIYPFQLGFWSALPITMAIGAISGIILGLPTIRLRGDYVAMVTLGFGEITQDALKNLDVISKGTQGINPLPPPSFFGHAFSVDQYLPWYYLSLGILALVVWFNFNLKNSRVGRTWISVREDELAARCMGINTVHTKLFAFSVGASLCALSGALWASYLGSTGEPSNYDFQMSIIALCIVIVGGMGSINGVLIGSLVMIGFNSIVLVKVSALLTNYNIISGQSVFTAPNNWKCMIFGFALIVMMRVKPEGLMPSRLMQAELHEKED